MKAEEYKAHAIKIEEYKAHAPQLRITVTQSISEEIFEEENEPYIKKKYLQVFNDSSGFYVDSQYIETSELYREACNNEVPHVIADVVYQTTNEQSETFYTRKKMALVRINIKL